MSDIFISYAKEDVDLAELFATALQRQGWSVFWDRAIAAGRTWRDTIGRELEQARCVVVLWSPHSIISDWVLDEADDARERRVLVPVLIANVRPPMGSRSIQAANLSQWDGTEAHPKFRKLLADISMHIGRSPTEEAEERQRAEAAQAARLAAREIEEEAARQAEKEREVALLKQAAEGKRRRAEEVERLIQRRFVLIAAPSDVLEERAAVCDAINKWNNTPENIGRSVVFVPLLWEMSAASDADLSPQEAINKQLLANADYVIAIFNVRLGTPTESCLSGTVEEITKRKDRAAVFFSRSKVVNGILSDEELQQLKALSKFQKELEKEGLARRYDDVKHIVGLAREQLNSWAEGIKAE